MTDDPLPFLDRFADEEACIRHVMARLWPNGPVCSHCGSIDRASHLRTRPRTLTCNAPDCTKQFSVTASTAVAGSRTPLRRWFRAIHFWEATGRGTMTRMDLARYLKISHHTARGLLERLPELQDDPVFASVFALAREDVVRQRTGSGEQGRSRGPR